MEGFDIICQMQLIFFAPKQKISEKIKNKKSEREKNKNKKSLQDTFCIFCFEHFIKKRATIDDDFFVLSIIYGL